MEKNTEVVARYHYTEGYYVEVISQIPYIGGRDYWLCNRGSENKLFMFSNECKSTKSEERMIARKIAEAIKSYERVPVRRTCM